MKFDELINYLMESSESDFIPSINPTDVYDTYFLEHLLSTGKLNHPHCREVFRDRMLELKEKYLRVFGDITFEQVQKYIERGRIDSDLTPDIVNSDRTNPKKMAEHMKKTYRSDMKRRNTVWEIFTEQMAILEDARSPEHILSTLDRINNCVHNTSEIMFSKLPNAQSLLSAFNLAHSARDVRAYKSRVSSHIRELESFSL